LTYFILTLLAIWLHHAGSMLRIVIRVYLHSFVHMKVYKLKHIV